LLVAKIETRSGVENLADIVQATDVVMVARGDLGIQMPLKDVPMLQKKIIRHCNTQGVPVITATQMLESMTRQPLPTRAEVGDVANAVLDGTDAVMLSEETAMGAYPVETVMAMADIVSSAEDELITHERTHVDLADKDDPVSWAVARAAVQAAEDLKASAIVCPTRSGATARRVSAFRPEMPVLGLGHSTEIVGALAVVWGVVPYLAEFLNEEVNAVEGVERAVEVARSAGCARPGDLVVVVAGGPGRRAGSTDFLRIVSA
jgi:pyruvate kinase